MYVHNLAYDDKPDYQKLKKILNPDGVPLGPLEFSTKVQSVHVRTPAQQKVSIPESLCSCQSHTGKVRPWRHLRAKVTFLLH
jgi:hypothetical protein